MSKILVTGGAGFIGSHLCERLLRGGNEVLCADNYFTGNRNNINALLSSPSFEALRHDITFPLYVEVDRLFNLAAPALPIHYQRSPAQTHVGTFQADGRTHPSGINFRGVWRPTGTSSAGILLGHVNPIGLRACYDEGTRCAETLFFDYQRQYATDIRVARIFNTYGPRMHPNDGRVVSKFIVQALKDVPLWIYGDGRQTRSFCYVDDMVDGLTRLMDSSYSQGPINLGNPSEITVIELSETVLRLTGSSSRIEHVSKVEDHPQQRQPDITLANSVLGWQPSVSLEDGLKETIRYFRELMN